MVRLVIDVDDPRRDDVAAVLSEHLRLMQEVTPAEGVFALQLEEYADPSITVYTARRDDAVLGVGALKDLGDGHAEIKSMHTLVTARGQGVGGALLGHLMAVAPQRGFGRVSLETGNLDVFEPARRMYEQVGFVECPPFGPYVGSPTSVCMTKTF